MQRSRALRNSAALAAAFAAAVTTAAAQEEPIPDGRVTPGQDVAPFEAPPEQAPTGRPPDAQKEAAPASSPEERDKLLTELYAQLRTIPDEQRAGPVVQTIERLWLYTGSDTIAVLMERSLKAVSDQNPDLALKLLDAVVDLAPEYAEGWNRRAYVLYTRNDYQRALGDLRRVLALEPNHFKALDGLGQILREIGEKKAALQAYRQLQQVHPNWPSIKQTVDELDREVEGQGI